MLGKLRHGFWCTQAFENGSYVARPELQESYRQSLEAAQQSSV